MDPNFLLESYGELGVIGICMLLFGFMITSLIKENKSQTVEVTFHKAIQESVINTLPFINKATSIKQDTWLIEFNTKEDMRPKIFDFAQENDLKILELKSENKTLETLFREVTA